MAENEQLNDFLATGTPEAPTGTPPGTPGTPPGTPGTPAAATPPPAESKPATPAPAPKEPAAKEPEHEDDDIAPLAGSDNRTVPFSALEKVRNDWKSKAASAEARAEELRRQLDEVKRQQATPPPAPAELPPPPDPAKDPQGWAANFRMEQQRMLLNERLNMSEAMVAERIGREDLDKYVADFKAAAGKDQTLWGKLYSQPSPYAWMTQEVDRLRQRAEIGDDPVAYKAKLRAEWEAEQAGTGPRTSPAAGLPPSLASARSVASRTQSTFTGPLPLEEILRKPAPANNRR